MQSVTLKDPHHSQEISQKMKNELVLFQAPDKIVNIDSISE